MPLPRFHRLPPDRQQEIIGIARGHFAEHGPVAASYNKIIAAAGISKTAAYHYFDGKDDLLATVLEDVRARLRASLGPWTPAATPTQFWQQLEAGAGRLVGHLAEHPDDLALTDASVAEAAAGDLQHWLGEVVDNGRGLGVIRDDVDRSLLIAVTTAVFTAADSWMLAALRETGAPSADDEVWSLLAGLWTRPSSPERSPSDAG